MNERTDYRPEIVIAILVGILVLICILAGCGYEMTPGEAQALQSFSQEQRLRQLEWDTQRIRRQQFFDRIRIP